MEIDLWKPESKLYAMLDAFGMRGQSELKEVINVSGNFNISVTIIDFQGRPLGNHARLNPNSHRFSINFMSGTEPVYRVDNDNIPLHHHLESGAQSFHEHNIISDNFTITEAVSFTFDSFRKITEWKYSDVRINESDGFVGSC